MTVRTTLPLIALTIALQPAHVSAQNTISYETGEYEYAQALPELDDDVVTETIAPNTTCLSEPSRNPHRPCVRLRTAAPYLQCSKPSRPMSTSSNHRRWFMSIRHSKAW